MDWWSRRRTVRWLLFALLLGMVVIAYVLAVRFAPTLILGGNVLADPGLSPAERLGAEYNARVTVVSVGGALVIGSGLLFTAFNYRLARQSHVRERLTTALERVGSTALYIRIGGIRSLEHFVGESADHHAEVTDVLVSFVQDRAPGRAAADSSARWSPYPMELPDKPGQDVQEAITVVGRLPVRPGRQRRRLEFPDLHLAGVNLSSSRLEDANLRGIQLVGANLRRAVLTGADLRDALLTGADLEDAQCQGTDMARANLDGTNLRQTRLEHAKLQDVRLMKADLKDAVLRDADLNGARLDHAHLWGAQLARATLVAASLVGADLRWTQLQGANLHRAHLVGANLSHADLSDANLLLANLTGADLSFARFDGALLEGVTLNGANLYGASGIATDEDPPETVREAPGPPVVAATGGHTTKRLVIACDGLWRPANISSPTNIVKVVQSVEPIDANGTEQRTFYSSGAGTRQGSRTMQVLGLSRMVRNAYGYLVQNFEPGDDLYFFGFSRGAYVARSVAAMVQICGILKREHEDRIDAAFALFRDRRLGGSGVRAHAAAGFRHSYSHETGIRFLGVLDTVGPLGVPGGLAALPGRRLRFHDLAVGRNVQAAYQALAIDETSRSFRPAIWRTQAGQHVEQVWFAGGHLDIGGGYTDSRLSDVTLAWLMDRARSCELAFAPQTVVVDPLASMHDIPRRGRAYIRPIGFWDTNSELVASTVLERRKELPDYHPRNLVSSLAGGDVKIANLSGIGTFV